VQVWRLSRKDLRLLSTDSDYGKIRESKAQAIQGARTRRAVSSAVVVFWLLKLLPSIASRPGPWRDEKETLLHGGVQRSTRRFDPCGCSVSIRHLSMSSAISDSDHRRSAGAHPCGGHHPTHLPLCTVGGEAYEFSACASSRVNRPLRLVARWETLRVCEAWSFAVQAASDPAKPSTPPVLRTGSSVCCRLSRPFGTLGRVTRRETCIDTRCANLVLKYNADTATVGSPFPQVVLRNAAVRLPAPQCHRREAAGLKTASLPSAS